MSTLKNTKNNLNHFSYSYVILIYLFDYRYFEYFILTMILLNSLALVLYDYSDRNSETQWNQYLGIIEWFYIIF